MATAICVTSPFVYDLPIMAPEHKINFAKLCLELRTEKGWTQAQMAAHLGVIPRLYRKYEAGDVKPGGNAAYILACMDIERKLKSNVADLINTSIEAAQKPDSDIESNGE